MIFESEYDWSQFLQGLIVSIALVFSGGNIVATLLSFFIFFLGCYYALGQKIIFFDSYFCYKTFFSKTNIEITDVEYIEFNPGFLGKSFFTIVLNNKNYNSYTFVMVTFRIKYELKNIDYWKFKEKRVLRKLSLLKNIDDFN